MRMRFGVISPMWEGEGQGAGEGKDGGGKDGGGDKSFLGGGGEGAKNGVDGLPEGFKWPENWKDVIVGPDKDSTKLLDNINDPRQIWKSYRELQVKLSQKNAAPAKPTTDDPEKLAAWREAVGLPKDETGYQLAETVAKRFGDPDKPNIDLFAKGAFKRDIPPAMFNAGLDIYADMVEENVQRLAATDKKLYNDCQDELRQEWGTDFRTNSALALQAAKELTPGIDWFEYRDPITGTRLGDNPAAVKRFAGLGKLIFGDAAFAGEDNTKVTTNRMAEIRALQGDTNSAYYTDGGVLKKELFDLVQAEERATARRSTSKEPTL